MTILKMMNIVALGFLLSSLVTAVVWSPEEPQKHQSMGVATFKPGEEKPKEVLMREGRRVIVLEYEKEEPVESAVGTANQYAKTTGEKVQDAGDEALHLIKTGADKTKDTVKATAGKAKDAASSGLNAAGTVKDRAEEAVKDQAHDTYDKTGQVYESAKDKVSQTLGSLKDAGVGVKEAVSSHLPDGREGNPEDSRDAKTSSVGVGETSEHMTGDIYGSAEGKISDVGEKIKEEGEQALKTAGETYDSTKESIKRAGDYVQRTVEDAKEKLRVKEHEEEQQAGLKSNVGEADILYKFRQAVDEVYRLSPELLEAAGKLEKQVLPLLSTRDPKDGARVRTANLVKDSVANFTTATVESSKGYYNLVLSRFCRWASKETLMTGLRLVHLLVFATVYGSSIWVNFIGGHVLARAIPRQQFGFLQSKLYPVYFSTVACGLAICLLAHSAVHPWRSSAKAQRWADCNLIFSLLLTLANMLYFEPLATKTLFERLRMEKEEGRGRDLGDMNINADNLSLNTATTTHDIHLRSGSCLVGDDVNCKLAEVNKKLEVFHWYSSALNMLCLASLTWHLAYLSSYLKI